MLEIASSYDVATTITNDNGSCLVLFTYNSPKILEIEEMDFLDERFGYATADLKSLLIDQKITILN